MSHSKSKAKTDDARALRSLGPSLPSRHEFLCKLAKSLATGVAVMAVGAGAPNRAEAALYADGTNSAQTLAFGAAFAGEALSFNLYVPGVGTGIRQTSATFLNSRYAITSAHNIVDLVQYNPTMDVGDGTNFQTNRGNVMPISGYLIHPAYDGTANTPDIAIIQFATPFYASQNKVIGSAVPGDTTISAGFGAWGTPAIGLSRDGGLRAWDARVSDVLFNGSPTYYQSTRFGYDNIGLSLNGRGAGGDSGGPVFNQSGELVGISDFATVASDPIGATTYLKLSSVEPWIAANAPVPEPSSLGLLGVSVAALLLRRRRP